LHFRRLHNTCFNKDRILPDDVLYPILERACVVEAGPLSSPWKHSSVFYGPTMFSGPMARILSGVCRRWRSFLLASTIVWSDIHITIRRLENLLWLDTCLALPVSPLTGCMIHISQHGIFQGPSIMKATSQHLSNIKCLYIYPTAMGFIYNETMNFLLSILPRMTHLSFNRSTLFYHTCKALNFSHVPGRNYPKLKFLGDTLYSYSVALVVYVSMW